MSLTWPRSHQVAANNNVFFVWCRRSRTGHYDTGQHRRGVRAVRLLVSLLSLINSFLFCLWRFYLDYQPCYKLHSLHRTMGTTADTLHYGLCFRNKKQAYCRPTSQSSNPNHYPLALKFFIKRYITTSIISIDVFC